MKVVGSTGEEALPAAAAAAKRRRVEPAKRSCGGRVGRQTRRRVHAESAAIQRLFAACRAAFRGPGTVPAPAEVDVLRAMLDKMRPEDVGLSSDMEFFKDRDSAPAPEAMRPEDVGLSSDMEFFKDRDSATAPEATPTITHTTIYKCDNFSMVILFLPATAVIPLHNHPGMTVFSKLLLGSMHIKSYDWLDPTVSTALTPQSRLARVVADDVFTVPCDTSVLYPAAGGNMHRFNAITPCAVLDVLGPPYSMKDGRDCTYYADFPYTHRLLDGNDVTDPTGGERSDRLAWLQEIDVPESLKIDCIEYGGPPIFES